TLKQPQQALKTNVITDELTYRVEQQDANHGDHDHDQPSQQQLAACELAEESGNGNQHQTGDRHQRDLLAEDGSDQQQQRQQQPDNGPVAGTPPCFQQQRRSQHQQQCQWLLKKSFAVGPDDRPQ